MILFCLPYAGGSEAIYYKWKEFLDQNIELLPIELKGRGRRFNEEGYKTFKEVIDDIFETIRNKVLDDNYAIYGHSMGSLLAYELYYRMDEEGLRIPKHMFFSGNLAPNRIKKDHLDKLPDHEFINEVVKMGGMKDEIIQNEDLMNIFIPILRNDFKIINNYHYVQRKNKISCSISVLNGKGDSFTREDILEWKNHCDKETRIYHMDGNHFFINDHAKTITQIITDTLNDKLLINSF